MFSSGCRSYRNKLPVGRTAIPGGTHNVLGRNLQTFGGDIGIHVLPTLFLVVFGVRSKGAGRCRWRWRGHRNHGVAGAVGEVEGFAWDVLQKGRDGWGFSVGVTGSSVEQQYRTAVFGAQKCARNSFNVTTSVRRGFLHDARAGAPWGGGGERLVCLNCEEFSGGVSVDGFEQRVQE